MKNRILVFAGIAALVINATAFGLNHGFQDKHGRGEGRRHADMVEHMARELNLTDTQKQEVKAIFDAQHSAEEARHVKLDELHKQIEAATANGQFDETQVRTLANQQAQLRADSMVEHLRMKSKVFGLLTAEQKAKAEEMHKRGGPHRKHGHPRSE